MSKTDQRKRRKAGFEQYAPTVFKPKFIRWLVWEEVLAEADVGDRAKVIEALERYLRERYSLPEIENEPHPAYAMDHPWEELQALRDRPPATQLMVFGVLELDRPRWQRRPNPTPYLITARTAAIRQSRRQHSRPDIIWIPTRSAVWRRSISPTISFHADDYDPEDDGEEEARDLQEQGTEQAVKDEEGDD